MASHDEAVAFELFNATRSPEDDWDRFLRCWSHQDCGGCMKSDAKCAWCPQSTTCVPLDATSTPLLQLLRPFTNAYRTSPTCPLPSERYELRTAALGCGCSPTTLAAAATTCVCTAALVLFVLPVLGALARWLWARATLRRTGYELRVVEEEEERQQQGRVGMRGRVWVREAEGRWWEVWRRRDGGEYAVQGGEEVVGDDGALDVGRRGWRRVWPFRLVAATRPVRWAEGRLPVVRERERAGERGRGGGHEADERTALL